jgi:anti-sigma regulatory factor (Ser/Thr protein kinase)
MNNESLATRVTLRLRAALEYRPLAIDLVSAMTAQVATADRTFRDEMVTAFGEAFNNLVTHGYRGRPDGMVDIEAEMTDDQITLRLIDGGVKVDFARIRPPDLDSLPESGMGVFMMHALVDEVSYCAGELNVLTLTKRVK